MFHIGEKIAHYRERRGMTRAELVEGICNESTLFRIEKGEQEPRLDTLNRLCRKLNIPVEYLIQTLDESEILYIDKVKSLCREFVYFRDHNALHNLIEYVEKNNLYVDIQEFNQFIRWHKAILVHSRDHDIDTATKELKQLLIEINHVISETDIGISNSLGLIYIERKQNEKALQLFELSYAALEKLPFIKDKTLPVRVKYNYSLALFYNRNFDQVINILYKTLYYLKVHSLKYMIGRIYHLLAITLEELGQLSEAEINMKKAVDHFKAKDMLFYYVKALRALSEIQFKMGNIEQGHHTLELADANLSKLPDSKDLPRLIEKMKQLYLT